MALRSGPNEHMNMRILIASYGILEYTVRHFMVSHIMVRLQGPMKGDIRNHGL